MRGMGDSWLDYKFELVLIAVMALLVGALTFIVLQRMEPH